MSVVEYRVLLYQFSEEIDWQTQRRKLIFILRAYLPDGSEGGITDIDSLLTMLEEKNILGIDRLNVMKELLKEIEKWDLLRRIERFEIKRKDYKQLLEKISHALDESNELQRLISICRGKNLIARERRYRGCQCIVHSARTTEQFGDRRPHSPENLSKRGGETRCMQTTRGV